MTHIPNYYTNQANVFSLLPSSPYFLQQFPNLSPTSNQDGRNPSPSLGSLNLNLEEHSNIYFQRSFEEAFSEAGKSRDYFLHFLLNFTFTSFKARLAHFILTFTVYEREARPEYFPLRILWIVRKMKRRQAGDAEKDWRNFLCVFCESLPVRLRMRTRRKCQFTCNALASTQKWDSWSPLFWSLNKSE